MQRFETDPPLISPSELDAALLPSNESSPRSVGGFPEERALSGDRTSLREGSELMEESGRIPEGLGMEGAGDADSDDRLSVSSVSVLTESQQGQRADDFGNHVFIIGQCPRNISNFLSVYMDVDYN